MGVHCPGASSARSAETHTGYGKTSDMGAERGSSAPPFFMAASQPCQFASYTLISFFLDGIIKPSRKGVHFV